MLRRDTIHIVFKKLLFRRNLDYDFTVLASSCFLSQEEDLTASYNAVKYEKRCNLKMLHCLRAEINAMFLAISFFNEVSTNFQRNLASWNKEKFPKKICFNTFCCIISPIFIAMYLTISPKLTHPPPTPLSANKACHFSALLRVKKNLNHGFIWGS